MLDSSPPSTLCFLHNLHYSPAFKEKAGLFAQDSPLFHVGNPFSILQYG